MASLPNTRADGKRSSNKDKTQALRKRIDASLDVLAKAVDDVRASETFKAYLDVQAKFHKYSWCNSLLILSQCPKAERVAGFQTWKKLKRHVKKGEHGIMIFAPCPWSKDNPKTGETDTGVFFRAVYVFDVSQTDGEELPTVNVPDLDVANDRLLALLTTVCENRGIKLGTRTLDGEDGHATDKGKTIAIELARATGHRAKVLAHELAHCALHFAKRDTSDGAKPMTRSMAELEAESVAYIVCQHFGLDSSVRSAAYIALWQGDSKALKASLQRIADTARTMIDDVEAIECRKAVA